MPGLPAASLPILHRSLGISMTGIAVVFAGIMAMGVGPLLREPDEGGRLIGYVMTGIALVEAAVALLVMKRRIPERRPGQSSQEFWSNAEVLNKILLVWFLLTGAGTLSAIAFLLSGLPAAAIVTAFVIAMFWMNGPVAFGR